MSQVSVNSDFYILLAALEVEALLRLHIKHLQENRRSARIPIVIQELYSDSNSMLLSDSCTFFDGSLPDTCTKTDRDFKAADVFEASNQHNTYVSSALLQVYY